MIFNLNCLKCRGLSSFKQITQPIIQVLDIFINFFGVTFLCKSVVLPEIKGLGLQCFIIEDLFPKVCINYIVHETFGNFSSCGLMTFFVSIDSN